MPRFRGLIPTTSLAAEGRPLSHVCNGVIRATTIARGNHLHVHFAPFATKLVRRHSMSRRARKRLHAIEELRHAALKVQLSPLDREIAKNFTYPEELALAQIPDTQGLGGHSEARGAA